MQVIEHDDEETHASFSPLSTGASLRSLQGIPLAAVGEESFCTGGQDTTCAKQQGRQAAIALSAHHHWERLNVADICKWAVEPRTMHNGGHHGYQLQLICCKDINAI